MKVMEKAFYTYSCAMKKIREGAACLAGGALLGAMLALPGISLTAAVAALEAFAAKVLPALAPQLFLMLLLSSRVPARGVAIVPMAWLCGSPGGARLVARPGTDAAAARRLCAATGTLSPSFFLGALGALTGDQAAARVMFACHIASAALAALPFRGGTARAPLAPAPLSLAGATDKTARAMLSVCALMMLGTVASALAGAILPLSDGALTALACAIEVTGGVLRLANTASPFKYPLLCAACSFGGLSVILQTAICYREIGVSVGEIIGIRLMHAAIAFSLCFLSFRVLIPA